MFSEPRSLICLFESFEGRVARDRQSLNERPLAVFRRQNLDAPEPVELHLAHCADEADDILGSVADKGAAVTGVFEQGSNRFKLGIAEFDAEDYVRVETFNEFRQRRIGAKDMPEVDYQSCRRVAGCSDQVSAFGHRADQTEGERFDRNAGSDCRRLVGDLAERVDERCDVVDWGSESGSYFDERRIESVCRF